MLGGIDFALCNCLVMLGGIDHCFVSLPMLTYGTKGRYVLSHELNTILVYQATHVHSRVIVL
jgi:hypothetical protein